MTVLLMQAGVRGCAASLERCYGSQAPQARIEAAHASNAACRARDTSTIVLVSAAALRPRAVLQVAYLHIDCDLYAGEPALLSVG